MITVTSATTPSDFSGVRPQRLKTTQKRKPPRKIVRSKNWGRQFEAKGQSSSGSESSWFLFAGYNSPNNANDGDVHPQRYRRILLGLARGSASRSLAAL